MKKYKHVRTGEIFEENTYPDQDTIYFAGNYYLGILRSVRQSYIDKHPKLFEQL